MSSAESEPKRLKSEASHLQSLVSSCFSLALINNGTSERSLEYSQSPVSSDIMTTNIRLIGGHQIPGLKDGVDFISTIVRISTIILNTIVEKLEIESEFPDTIPEKLGKSKFGSIGTSIKLTEEMFKTILPSYKDDEKAFINHMIRYYISKLSVIKETETLTLYQIVMVICQDITMFHFPII